MRRLTRVAVAAAVAAGVTGAPVPARATEVPAALVVPATGVPVATPFVTSPALRYTITVSGTFAADRTGGLADCGYRDVNAGLLGQEWEAAGSGLLVDAAPPWCGPYTDTHRYAFQVAGTGAPLAFSISDASGTADNSGALTVEVLAESVLRADCYDDATGVGAGGGGELVAAAVVAVAWHEGIAADVVATSVACLLLDGASEPTAQATSLGPVAVAAALVWIDSDTRPRFCVSATDWRTDGTSRSTGWSCSTQLLEET